MGASMSIPQDTPMCLYCCESRDKEFSLEETPSNAKANRNRRRQVESLGISTRSLQMCSEDREPSTKVLQGSSLNSLKGFQYSFRRRSSVPTSPVEECKESPPKSQEPDELDSLENATQAPLVPVWMKEPTPLAGWTRQHQQVLLIELKQHPAARKNPNVLKLVFEKTHRALPSKSVEDIEKCYRHIENSRIVYFGSGKFGSKEERRSSA
jgi:hypothetical protein